MQQGDQAWLELRPTKVTSTDAGSIEGVNPYESQQKWLRKKVRSILGIHEDLSHIPAVAHGSRTESIALEWFEELKGLEEGGWDQPYQLHRAHDWLMSSIDKRYGLSSGAEVKCPFTKYTKQPYTVYDKPSYLVQCRHHMEVCDLDHLYFVCYISPDVYHIDELDRDPNWLTEMLPGRLMPTPRSDKVTRLDLYHAWFNHAHDEAKDPAKAAKYLDDDDSSKYKDVQDGDIDRIQELTFEQREIDAAIEPQLNRAAEIKEEIETLRKSMGDKYDASVTNGTVKIQIIKSKGTIDYSKAFDAVDGEDLLAKLGKRSDDFRRKDTKRAKIILEETHE